MFRVTCLLLLLSIAGACDVSHATSRGTAIDAELALPDGVRQMLPAEAKDRRRDEFQRMQSLVEFMVADDGLALRYQEHPTYGIAESLALRRVNCLSFTMIFVAMARASGLDAFAQASDDALTMRVLDGALYRATHVNAGIQAHDRTYTADVGAQAVVAGRRPQRISDARTVALLRNNHAVEYLLQGDHARANETINAAIALDASNAAIWNNAGVVHWRAGRSEAAERAYLRALKLQGDHVGALSNLVALYRAGGAVDRLGRYEKRLQRAQASDPFSQFLAAQSLAGSGAHAAAIEHYQRAIRLLPGEPLFHRGLAQAFQDHGDAASAERSRERASRIEARQAARRRIRDAGEPGPG